MCFAMTVRYFPTHRPFLPNSLEAYSKIRDRWQESVSIPGGFPCHACEPMVACRLEDCFAAWGNKVAVWGGMPCVMLEPHVSETEYKAHLAKLANLAQRGMRLIVGVSDHTMPDASYARIAAMARFFPDQREQ